MKIEKLTNCTHECVACERLRDMARVHYPRTRIGFAALGIMFQVWWLSLSLPERIALQPPKEAA